MSWSPEVYGIFAVGSSLFAYALSRNIPTHQELKDSPSLIFALIGFWSFPVILFGFSLFHATGLYFLAPSVLPILLHFGLLLPALALLFPLQKQAYTFNERRRYFFFFWGYILLVPLAVPIFSSSSLRVGFAAGVQFIVSLTTLSFLIILWKWWSQPQKSFTFFFPEYLRRRESQSDNHLSKETIETSQQLDIDKELESFDHLWRPFFIAGLGLLAVAFIAPMIYAFIRLQDLPSSPLWLSSQMMLFVGSIIFWLLGGFYMLNPPTQNKELKTLIKHQLFFGLLGIALFVLGCWGETTLHFYGDLLNVSRGTIYPFMSRMLSFLGAIILVYPVYLIVKIIFPNFHTRKI